MLERIDLEEKPLEKEIYKALRRELTQRLVVLQQQAVQAGAGLVVLFEGWDTAGKGSRISDLLYFLDARATKVYVPTDVNAKEQKKLRKLERTWRARSHHLFRSRLVYKGNAAFSFER